MEPHKIIETLIKEIDPNNELGDDYNVALAIVVSDKYHKLKLGDLRESLKED